MRQCEDFQYYQMVQPSRKGQLSQEDHIQLLSHLICNENSIQLDATIIVRRHHDRYRLNKIQFDLMLHYTQDSNISSGNSNLTPTQGLIFIRSSMTNLSNQKWISNFFQASDRNHTKAPTFFRFIPQIPVMINDNLFTHLGVVNGKQCIALGLPPHPEGISLILILEIYFSLIS